MPILSIAHSLALSHHRGRLAIQRSPFIYLLRKGNSNGMDQRSLFQIHVYQTTPQESAGFEAEPSGGWDSEEWLENGIYNSWDEYAGEETRHTQREGSVRM